MKIRISLFSMSLYIYAFYCFTTVLRWLPVVTVQMPIIMLAFVLLLLGTFSYSGRQRGLNLLIFTGLIVIFNYVFVFLQNSSDGTTLVNRIGANFTLFVVTFPLLFLYSGALEYVDRKQLLTITFIIILITAVTTIVGTYMYASPCRELATPDNTELDNLYKSKNIGGYGFVYALVVMCPLMLRNMIRKFDVRMFVVIIISALCVLHSEYTTALILFALGISLSIAIYKRNIVLGIVSVVALILLYANLENILLWGIEHFSDSYSVSSRLRMLLEYHKYDTMTGDLLERANLYTMSFSAFLNNPLFGSLFKEGQQIGGHSEILDYLGHSGLLGIIALTPIVNFVKNTPIYRNIKKDSFYVATVIITIFLAFTNTYCAPELTYAILIMPILLDGERMYMKMSE